MVRTFKNLIKTTLKVFKCDEGEKSGRANNC